MWGGASGMIRLLFCLVRQAVPVPVPVPGPPPSQPAANRHRQPGNKYIQQSTFIYLFIYFNLFIIHVIYCVHLEDLIYSTVHNN